MTPSAAAANGVVVTGIGMMTPVGYTAEQSCAAIRAGIALIGELEYFVVENDWFEKVPIMGAAMVGETDGYVGLGRWTRMASAAIADLLETNGLGAKELTSTGLYLALPPVTRGGVDERVVEMLGLRIAQWRKIEGLERRTRVFPEGHAAAAAAFAAALADIASGRFRHAIVCGVDSLVEPATLTFLHEKRRLKTEDNVDGFIPGEAAACVLLEQQEQATEREATILASIEAPSTATEPVTIWSDDACQGTGLSEAIAGTVGRLADRGNETGLLVCDLNGETYRAKEFGTAAPRALGHVEREWELWHPADSVGDTGAASFAVSAVLAAQALSAGYAKTDGVLVWGSSDDGLRGSVYLRRHNGQ